MQSLKHSHIWRCSDEVMPYIVLHEVTISFCCWLHDATDKKKMQQSSGYLKTAQCTYSTYLYFLTTFFRTCSLIRTLNQFEALDGRCLAVYCVTSGYFVVQKKKKKERKTL